MTATLPARRARVVRPVYRIDKTAPLADPEIEVDTLEAMTLIRQRQEAAEMRVTELLVSSPATAWRAASKMGFTSAEITEREDLTAIVKAVEHAPNLPVWEVLLKGINNLRDAGFWYEDEEYKSLRFTPPRTFWWTRKIWVFHRRYNKGVPLPERWMKQELREPLGMLRRHSAAMRDATAHAREMMRVLESALHG